VGHETFHKTLTESGERHEGPGLPADAGSAFLCGYYLVDRAGKERAIEVAALAPEAAFTGIEVREIVYELGAE
jgi:hypothetical protein